MKREALHNFLSKITLVLIMSAFVLPSFFYAASGLTFSGGGRLGDKLKVFIKTLYFAEKLKLSFVCPTFSYAEEFKFNSQKAFTKRDVRFSGGRRIITQQELESPHFKREPHILYVLKYSADDGNFIDGIKDELFINKVRKLLSPAKKITPLRLPHDKISIAIHVRKGSGLDAPAIADACDDPSKLDTKREPSDKIWPTKFPPDDFYIEQLKMLSHIFGEQLVYVFLFTDDKNPERLVEKYQSKLQKPTITFDYRTGTHDFSSTMIEDFFAITQFDCLIRPDSGFSHIPEFLGNHAIVISPQHAFWQDNQLIVDKISVKVKNRLVKNIRPDITKLQDEPSVYTLYYAS